MIIYTCWMKRIVRRRRNFDVRPLNKNILAAHWRKCFFFLQPFALNETVDPTKFKDGLTCVWRKSLSQMQKCNSLNYFPLLRSTKHEPTSLPGKEFKYKQDEICHDSFLSMQWWNSNSNFDGKWNYSQLRLVPY